MRSCGRAARSFPLTFSVAQLISEQTRLGCRSNASFCAVFFLPVEVWERVSDRGYHKWLFWHLPRSERKTEIDSAKKKQEIGGLSWPTSSQNLRSVVRKFWTFSRLASYIFLLGAYVPDRTDCWCERLRFCTRANVGMFFAFWMVASWNRPRRDSRVTCMYRKWGECRKPSENVNCLASYSFRKPTGYFHSHLCLWQYFTRAKSAWPRKRPLLSTHAFAWS